MYTFRNFLNFDQSQERDWDRTKNFHEINFFQITRTEFKMKRKTKNTYKFRASRVPAAVSKKEENGLGNKGKSKAVGITGSKQSHYQSSCYR